MRVLFALPGLHRVVRGAEVALEELARHLACIPGFEVSVIGSGPPRLFEPYQYNRVRCVRREWVGRFPSVPYLRDHYSYEELSFVPGLYLAYKPQNYDVTVTCGYPYTSWMLRRGRRSHGPRHVYVTQNGDWMCHANNWEYRHFACDGLVCTNPDYYARAVGRWPSALIPNGVNPTVFEPGVADRAEFGLPAYGAVVLMVSALIPSKRVLDGIRAVSKLPDVHLVIAGTGELRDEVTALGRQLLPDRFLLLNVPRNRMPALYRCADLFLHMSQDEPSANAYIEALASGLAIVTHDRHVTRWTLEDTAVYVDTSSIDDVVRGIHEAVRRRTPADVARRRDMVHRRFSWSQIAHEYGEFFRKVCGAPSTSARSKRMEVAQ